MKKPVDELRVARALKALDEHAAVHPEAFDPARLPTTPTALATALGEKKTGRPPSDDPMQVFTCRLPRSMIAEIEQARGDRTAGDVTREAITRWLKTVRRRPRAR